MILDKSKILENLSTCTVRKSDMYRFLLLLAFVLFTNARQLHNEPYDVNVVNPYNSSPAVCSLDSMGGLQVLSCRLPDGQDVWKTDHSDIFHTGTTCKVACQGWDTSNTTGVTWTSYRQCDQQGYWVGPQLKCDLQGVFKTSAAHTRKKRFLSFIAGAIACYLLCPRGGEKPDTNPPVITCQELPVQIAPKQQTSATVTWAEPTAEDKECGNEVTVTQTQGGKKGSEFEKGSYTVIYEARDCHGLPNHCSISFEVQVITCSPLRYPRNGQLQCSRDSQHLPVWGDTCQFECNTGYQLSDPALAHQECTEHWKWSQMQPPTCEPVTCPEPAHPDNTEIQTCTCGSNYVYECVCAFHCKDGFKFPPGGNRITTCEATKTWSADITECIDSIPPIFTKCPANINAYADKNLESTTVTWDQPEIEDNVDPDVNPTLTGSPPGSIFSLGVHEIMYTAEDAVGNRAVPCSFFVVVAQIYCLPITTTNRLNILCPDGLKFGAVCSFSCQNGYPRVGPENVTCESSGPDNPLGYWDWDGGNQTYCDVQVCGSLDRPDNGALACDKWLFGLICQMQCQADYDIPRSAAGATGQFVCDDTKGTWSPNDNVPDCSATRRPGFSRLPSEVTFYFEGSCEDTSTQAQIKQNFIDALNTSDFRTACTAYEECSVDNVEVFCGTFSGRKKRDTASYIRENERNLDEGTDQGTYTIPRRLHHQSQIISSEAKSEQFHKENQSIPHRFKRGTPTHEAIVTFDLLQKIDYSEEDLDKRWEKLDSKFKSIYQIVNNRIKEGHFDMTGIEGFASTDKDSFKEGYALPQCDTGQEARENTFTCAGCPTGEFYNEAHRNCSLCPAGTYQDEDSQLSCKTCPEGTSNVMPGARNVSYCIDVCPPGMNSTTGLEKCFPCPLNTYQDKSSQTMCMDCPEDTFTISAGSSDPQQCLSQTGCDPDPCNGHHCYSLALGYECRCQRRYTGVNCDTAPDYCAGHLCQNGATCQVQGEGYICQCDDNHRGTFCDKQITHGGWSEWSQWSVCTVSCGAGTQTRQRQCDNPAPDDDGRPCEGAISQSQQCNIYTCPKCEPLQLEFGVRSNCTTKGETIKCTIFCWRRDHYFEREPLSSYKCGPETQYIWTHQIDDKHATLPKCLEAYPPNKIRVHNKVSYDIDCEAKGVTSTDVKSSFVSASSGIKDNASCVKNGKCTVTTQVTGCESRKKRDTGASSGTVTITNTIESNVGMTSFSTSNTYDEDEVSYQLSQYVSLLSEVTDYSLQLNDSIHDQSLGLKLGGETFLPETEQFSQIGSLDCLEGQGNVNAVCGTCPTGTYSDGELCVKCPLGTYQDLEGQTSCQNCEDGTTTNTTGNINSDSCLNFPTTTTESTTSSTTTTPETTTTPATTTTTPTTTTTTPTTTTTTPTTTTATPTTTTTTPTTTTTTPTTTTTTPTTTTATPTTTTTTPTTTTTTPTTTTTTLTTTTTTPTTTTTTPTTTTTTPTTNTAAPTTTTITPTTTTTTPTTTTTTPTTTTTTPTTTTTTPTTTTTTPTTTTTTPTTTTTTPTTTTTTPTTTITTPTTSTTTPTTTTTTLADSTTLPITTLNPTLFEDTTEVIDESSRPPTTYALSTDQVKLLGVSLGVVLPTVFLVAFLLFLKHVCGSSRVDKVYQQESPTPSLTQDAQTMKPFPRTSVDMFDAGSVNHQIGRYSIPRPTYDDMSASLHHILPQYTSDRRYQM